MIEKRLGRGLESLISSTTPAQQRTGQVVEIELEAIVPNPNQPRHSMDEEALEGLASSIRRHGVLQPVVVQRAGTGYQLIAGERRVRASRLAGKRTIHALVLDVEPTKSLEMALIENIQRENLSALEEASAYEALLAGNAMTHQELADQLGKARATVTNTLRLLELPDTVKHLIQTGELSAGQARAVLAAGSPGEIESLARKVAKEGLTVREVEHQVRESRGTTKARRRRRAQKGGSGKYEEQLRRLYGTRVVLSDKGGRGEIRFEFYSSEDRDRLLHQLLTGESGETPED